MIISRLVILRICFEQEAGVTFCANIDFVQKLDFSSLEFRQCEVCYKVYIKPIWWNLLEELFL